MAQTGAEQRVPTELDTIEVVVPVPPPEARRRDIVAPVVGLDRDRIETSPATRLGDVLTRLPGVTIGGPPGENKDVRLRGLDKEFTRTEFSGFSISDGGEKREFQVFRFPAQLVETVDVIRNPSASLEADGIGGRIAVGFRPIPQDRLIELETAVGRGTGGGFGDTRRLQALAGQRFGLFGAMGAASLIENANSKDKVKTQSNGNGETETEEADQRFVDLFLDFGVFAGAHEVHFRPLLLNLDEEKDKTKDVFNGGTLNRTEVSDEDETRRSIGLLTGHVWRGPAGQRWENRFGVVRTTEDKAKRTDRFNGAGVFQRTDLEDEDKADRTFEAETDYAVPLTLGLPQVAQVGAAARWRDRHRDKTTTQVTGGVPTDTTDPTSNYQLDELYLAAYAQSRLSLARELFLTPGLRVEQVRQDAASGDGFQQDKTITDLLPSAHLTWLPTEALSFRASVSRQVNRPKFDDLSPYLSETGNSFVRGNADLDPARAWSFDVGGAWVADALAFDVNLFHREIDGVLEQVSTGQTLNGKDVFEVQNVGDGFAQGIELEQRVGLGDLGLGGAFTLRGAQTLIRSELTDNAGDTRRFREQPTFVGGLGLSWEHAATGTVLSAFASYVSETPKDEAAKRVRIDSELFLDLYAETRLTDGVAVFATAKNVTGQERTTREYANGALTSTQTEETGRVFMVGLKARF
jgi:outer membrane receptor protein involved in Fe transport